MAEEPEGTAENDDAEDGSDDGEGAGGGKEKSSTPKKEGGGEKDDGCSVEDKPAGNPAKPCKYADPPKPDPIIPQHLKVFDVEGKAVRFWNKKTNTIQIVPTADVDELTIVYSGPKIPPFLNVSRPGYEDYQVKGGGTYKVDAKYEPDLSPYFLTVGEDGDVDVFGLIFTSRHQIVHYTISHPDLPASINVDIFNPDQWKLKLSLPPLKSKEVGWKLEDKKAPIAPPPSAPLPTPQDKGIKVEVGSPPEPQKATVFQKGATWALKEYDSWKTTANSWMPRAGHLDNWKKEPPKGLKSKEIEYNKPGEVNGFQFNLTRNDVSIQIYPLHVIGSVLDIIESFEKLTDFISKWEPKYGWYATFSFQFLQGNAEFAWGYREHTNWQVYYYQGLALNVKIFEVSVEIGIGIETPGLAGQLCVKLTGELSYALTPYEVKGPGDILEKPRKFGEAEVVVTPGCYGRIRAGGVLNIEVGVEAPIKVKFGAAHSKKEGWECELEGLSEGVVAKIYVGPGVFNYQKKIQIIDGGTIGSTKWPEKHEPEAEEIGSEHALADLFNEKFSEGWWPLEFFDTKGESHWYSSSETDVPNVTAAGMVATKVWKRRHAIRMDRKDMEGLLIGVRADLDVLGYRRFRNNRLSMAQLDDYLNNGDFNHRISAMSSIAKSYAAVMRQG